MNKRTHSIDTKAIDARSNDPSEQYSWSLEEYFQGRTYAWGLFEDRFGKVRRQFTVQVDGHWDGETLTLHEYFLYDDHKTETRTWIIHKHDNACYRGAFGEIVGDAKGRIKGNTLSWKYTMNLKIGERTWRVNFDDQMHLQPNGIMINRATMSKWGFELGQVTLFFTPEKMLSAAPFILAPKQP